MTPTCPDDPCDDWSGHPIPSSSTKPKEGQSICLSHLIAL